MGSGGKVGRSDVAVGVGAAVGVGGGVAGIGVAVCVGGGAAVAAGEGVGTLRAGGAGEDVAGAADCGRSDVGATAGATGPAGAPEPGGGPGSVGVTGAATCAVALGVGLMGAGWLPCGVDVPRACGPTSTVNANTTAASPANATVSRAKRNVYATATLGTLAVGDPPLGEARSFALSENYPNPMRTSTTFPFDVPRASHVTLDVMDVTGRVVTTLVDGEQPPGRHACVWSASAVPSGMYFARLRAGAFQQVRRVVLAR